MAVAPPAVADLLGISAVAALLLVRCVNSSYSRPGSGSNSGSRRQCLGAAVRESLLVAAAVAAHLRELGEQQVHGSLHHHGSWRWDPDAWVRHHQQARCRTSGGVAAAI